MFDADSLIIKQNEALISRRFGRIMYTKEMLENFPEAIKKMYTKLVPIELKYDFAKECFDLVALNDNFEPVPVGSTIPQYQVLIKRHPTKRGGTSCAYRFDFVKVD